MSTRGRPTLYKAENAELARKFCMLGVTNEDLARCLEVSRSTIDHWIDTIPEFADSSRQGRDLADAAVIQKLNSRAMGFTTEIKKHVIYRGELREIPIERVVSTRIRGLSDYSARRPHFPLDAPAQCCGLSLSTLTSRGSAS
jgi:hypothetical protein